MSDKPLAGQRAFVTGAARGIGEAIARRLAADGAHVVVADLDRPAAEQVAASINGTALHLDVTDLARVEQAIQDTGPFTILVNNAGVDQHAFFTKTTPADWRRLIAINLESVFATTHAALPAMQAARYGRIINIAS
jgi:2-hydroxycyclohexanecarboxyl-CoA dehydrogenase